MKQEGSKDMKLKSLEEALALDRDTTRQLYRQYVNPSLVEVMSLLDFDKAFVKAQGFHVWDAQGRIYLDFLGGYGALNLGHNPPEVWEAVRKVSERPSLLQASLSSLAAALGHNLAQVTPGDLERTFFCNSGAEAVEGALKLARAANPGKKRILYCRQAFHGKSFGALSVTGREKYQQPFKPLLPLCEAIPFDDLAALEAQLQKEDVAAFIVEPVQGEGGVIVPSPGYLAGVRRICDQYGCLLVVDEIQTGLGRTGYLFACQKEGIVPDIMCLAKSLGGGVMPVGAYIARPSVWDRAYSGMDKYALHTSTFGGNAPAMAAGIAALRAILDQDLSRQALEKGRYLLEKLESLKSRSGLIKEVRGQGLLLGLEFNQPVGGFFDKLTGGKVNEVAHEYLGSLVAGELLNKYQIITAYTLNNPNVVRLEPPLTVSYEALDRVVISLEEVLARSGFGSIMFNSVRTVLSSKIKASR